jgi:hypothetical protein
MLFDDEEHERQGRVDQVTDAVREQFGSRALRRGWAP